MTTASGAKHAIDICSGKLPVTALAPHTTVKTGAQQHCAYQSNAGHSLATFTLSGSIALLKEQATVSLKELSNRTLNANAHLARGPALRDMLAVPLPSLGLHGRVTGCGSPPGPDAAAAALALPARRAAPQLTRTQAQHIQLLRFAACGIALC